VGAAAATAAVLSSTIVASSVLTYVDNAVGFRVPTRLIETDDDKSDAHAERRVY
jgi:hypothetical protein